MPSVISGDANVSATEFGYLDGVTSALQSQIDAKLATPGAWTTYTPTWTNLTVGNGTNEGRYTQIGKLVVARIRFTLGSTSSVGTAPTFSLPITANTDLNTAGQTIFGRCSLRDTGTGTFNGSVAYSNSTTAILFCDTVSGTRIINNDVTAAAPFTWTNTDIIHATITYEAA